VLAAIREAFPAAELTGSELSAAGLGFAARRVAGARLMQMDGRHIPYEDAFDVIGAFDVLEHIDDDIGVLRQMRRAVMPGGGVVISVPQHRWLWSGVDEYGGHVRRYVRRELLDKISAAGFIVEHVTSFMTLVLPVMMAARLRARSAASLDPAAELKVGSVTNAALGFLCACEARAIVRSWSLPVGGSLLAVARRTA
jgi:SAM-dependent methyltransferase